jgi:raffinose/stachyose/melibiose transport system permease protein
VSEQSEEKKDKVEMRNKKKNTISYLSFKNKTSRIFITIILSMWGIISLYPMLYTIISSFKTRSGYAQNRFGLPGIGEFTVENYITISNRFNFLRLTLNSIIVTTGGVVLCTIIAFSLAYAVTKLRLRGSNYLFLLVIATLMIPNQTIMYPLYQTAFDLKLVGTYFGLILIFAAFGLPLGTFLIAAYLRGVPDALIEAARIDGANHFQVMWRVIFPIAIPAVVTVAIINTVWMWNDLLLPLLLIPQPEKTTLMVAVGTLRSQYDINIPLISSGLVISVIPVVIAYLLGQRQLIKGMTAGAIKS